MKAIRKWKNRMAFILRFFMFEKWSLRDVILLALLAILFGGIFVGSGFLYNILTAILLTA